jgi:hypothetical protein
MSSVKNLTLPHYRNICCYLRKPWQKSLEPSPQESASPEWPPKLSMASESCKLSAMTFATLLLGTIASIEAQIQRNASICQTLDSTSALRFVEQSVNALNAVIQKLNFEIAHKRKLGSIKTAWKKKKVLEAHMAKKERSKSALGLAVSAYST